VPLADLRVRFEVWTTGTSPTEVTDHNNPTIVPVNVNGDAGTLVTLLADSKNNTALGYEIRAYLLDGSCEVGVNDVEDEALEVDIGSTNQRVVGGGWISSLWSDNGKGNFGFVAGYTTKGKAALTGNSVFMLHKVAKDGTVSNWKVKDSSWSGGTLTFYSQITGATKVDSARFTFKGVVQQLNDSGASIGGFGNAAVTVDVFDGDVYSPAQKDKYSIKVYNGTDLWFGSTSGMLPMGGSGPGGGNIKIFLGTK
jgi:hypothetical protein